MRPLLVLLLLSALTPVTAKDKPTVRVENITIEYKGKQVKAKRLTVTSEIPIRIENAWENIQMPALLQFVSKGMIRFKSTDGEFPPTWVEGQTYGAKMFVFGFVPFGGTHHLFIEKVDHTHYAIATKEWDNRAKVWNHDVVMKDLGNGKILYEDSIIIYGGIMTGFITSFAKAFYKHRRKRWQLVARENLSFTSGTP